MEQVVSSDQRVSLRQRTSKPSVPVFNMRTHCPICASPKPENQAFCNRHRKIPARFAKLAMDIRQLTDKCEAGTIIRLLAIRHRCAEGTIRNHLKRQDFTPHHIWERKGTGGITQTKLEQSIKMKIIT